MFFLLKEFLIHPENIKQRQWMTLSSFIFLFVINFFIVILFLFLQYHIFGEIENSLSKNFEKINENIVFYLIFGVFFFPIWEEYLHRFYLNYRIKYLLISTVLSLFVFILNFEDVNPLQNSIHFLFFLFLLVISLLKIIYNIINVKVLIWGSILFFGLFHLSTYEREIYENNYLMVPVLIMSQFITGFFLSFIRIKYHFIHCILYHGFFNLIVLTLGFISYKFFGS